MSGKTLRELTGDDPELLEAILHKRFPKDLVGKLRVYGRLKEVEARIVRHNPFLRPFIERVIRELVKGMASEPTFYCSVKAPCEVPLGAEVPVELEIWNVSPRQLELLVNVKATAPGSPPLQALRKVSLPAEMSEPKLLRLFKVKAMSKVVIEGHVRLEKVGDVKVPAELRENLVFPVHYEIKVRKLTPRIRYEVLRPKSPLKLRLREDVGPRKPLEVLVKLLNIGDGAASNVSVEVDGARKEIGVLEPGESIDAKLLVYLERPGSYDLKVKVRYTEPSGGERSLEFGLPRIEVVEPELRPTQPPTPAELPVPSQPPKQPLSLSDLESALVGVMLDAGAKALLGYASAKVVSTFRPLKRRTPKRVVVRDLPWTLEEKGDFVTVRVFEHPAAVAIEERGDVVLVRRATVSEVLSSISAKAARDLQIAFMEKLKSCLAEWWQLVDEGLKPSGFKYRELSLGDIKKELERAGIAVEGGLEELPRNPSATWEWKKGYFGKALVLKAYTLSRLDRLYLYGYDREPMGVSDVHALLPEKEPKHDLVVVIASPTGWDEVAKEQIRSHARPKVHVMLVDLKTMELVYNPRKYLLSSLADYLSRDKRVLVVPEEVEGMVEQLDVLLLEGKISFESYISELRKLGAKLLLS